MVFQDSIARFVPPDQPSPPSMYTGCVSELSCCVSLHSSYLDAVKQFAKVYQSFQAHLATDKLLLDPSAVAEYVPHPASTEGAWYGQANLFSDEEIEAYGYLGWLRHRKNLMDSLSDQ